jgi:hypothetical protein
MAANSRNNFGLLSSSQEPSQLIAQAANTAKNKKKREKAKGRKNQAEAADCKEGHAAGSNDLENQATPAQQAVTKQVYVDFDALQRQFAQDAQNRDCWSVWDGWLKRVRQALIDLRCTISE